MSGAPSWRTWVYDPQLDSLVKWAIMCQESKDYLCKLHVLYGRVYIHQSTNEVIGVTITTISSSPLINHENT